MCATSLASRLCLPGDGAAVTVVSRVLREKSSVRAPSASSQWGEPSSAPGASSG